MSNSKNNRTDPALGILLELFKQHKKDKTTINNIPEKELYDIFKELYNRNKRSFGTLENAKNTSWRKAIEKVKKDLAENRKSLDNYDEDQFEDDGAMENLNNNDELKYDDTDDLIQPEFPTEYIPMEHEKKLKELSNKLGQQRQLESDCFNEKENLVKSAIMKKIKESKNELNETEKKNNPSREEKTRQSIGGNLNDNNEEMKKFAANENKLAKKKMREKIKDGQKMNNDEFLLFLCILRKKKESKYESNPYIVDYSIDLDTVYQNREVLERRQNSSNNKTLFNFEDLNTNLANFSNEFNK